MSSDMVFIDNVYEGDDGRLLPLGPQSGKYAADKDGARVLDENGKWLLASDVES